MIQFKDVGHHYYCQKILKHKWSSEEEPLHEVNQTRINNIFQDWIPVLKRFSYADQEVANGLDKIYHCEENKTLIPLEISALKIHGTFIG